MIPNRWPLIACVLLGLAGCRPVAKQTFPERQLEAGPERLTPKDDAPLFQASDDPEVIVDRVIHAYGGPEKCTQWKTGRLKFKANFFPGLESEIEEWFQLPGKFKRVVWAAEGIKRRPALSFAINGDRGWTTTPNGSVVPLVEGSEAKTTEHRLGMMFNPLHLRGEGCKLTVLGEENVGDRKTVALRVESPDQARSVLLDERTGLMLKIRAKLPKSLSKDETEAETDLSEYREFEGAKVPTRMTARSQDRVLLDITIIELEFLDKIDDKVFAKP